MSFTAGTQVGPYRIMEQLGQGGMATVYKAYHASLDRYVAIKVLHRAFMEDAGFQTRFQREARVVARLDHPNIVPIYDYAEQEGQPYLVMKYIEGDTLKARLQRGALTASEVTHIIESVGAALSYAHKQGILHRDVKPSNVINANEGQIYLADFGLARIAQSGESSLTSDTTLGTPQYMSPEQAMAKKDLDEGTDIYSFGVMLYEMTVGRVPFSSDTPFSVIHDHIYTPLPLPSAVNPSISPALERVLLKALSKERADRYKDVASLVAAFKEAWTTSTSTLAFHPAPETDSASPVTASSPLTIPIQPEPVAPSVTPTAKASKRWLWGAAALVPLCLCCIVGFALLRPFNRNTPSSSAPRPEPSTSAPANDTATPDDTPALDTGPIPQISLDQAKQMTDQKPKDARAHLMYGFALLKDKQLATGYDQIKKGVNLAGKNQVLLLNAANSLADQKEWLAAAIVYMQFAKNAKAIPPARWDTIYEAVYYGFQEEGAPEILDYDTISKVDPSLALIAQASYTVENGGDENAAQSAIDQLKAANPALGEIKLLQGQLLIDQNHNSDAKTLLQNLINAPNTSAWIKNEANTILSEIE